PLVKDLLESKRLRVLGISSLNRSKTLPNVPTLSEEGVRSFNVVSTMGFFAPRGLPADVRKRLGSEIAAVLAEPEIQKRLIGLGMELESMPLEKYEQLLQEDFKRYETAVKQAGITLD
ncbi:MAG: tripartite tricarboxylate transporter substrate binding protein, partial [Cytophagaceae bacterium]